MALANCHEYSENVRSTTSSFCDSVSSAMKKSGIVFLLGLFCTAFQQTCLADTCSQISEKLVGEWQFDNTHTLKFEGGNSFVALDGKRLTMSVCSIIPSINVSFFINGLYVIIYPPKQQEVGARMFMGLNTYELTRRTSVASDLNASTQLETNAKDSVLVLPSQKYEEQFLSMKNSGVVPVLAELAKAVDPNFRIITKECGVINAWYSPQEKSITLCYDYLGSADKFIDDNYQNESIETQATLKTGIFIGVLLHELGHAIIDLHKIPIIGGEEDAADRIATIFLLQITEKNPTNGKIMIAGILAHDWARKSSMLDKLFSTDVYSDEHPITEQRVFNIMCLAYGSNPSLFSDTASQLGLSSERASRCQNEYLAAKSAVKQLIK